MKTSTRRWLGVALIGVPFFSMYLVALLHVFPETLVATGTSSPSPSNQNTATWAVYSAHVPLWFRIILLASIIIGLLLLIWPKHEKTNV
jgi:hypothetical protein